MAESKYEIIQRQHDVHAEQEEDDLDDIDNSNNGFFRTHTLQEDHVINTNNNNIYSKPYANQNIDIMTTPSAILVMILIYFGLSIGLTFYQQELVNVSLYCLHLFCFEGFFL